MNLRDYQQQAISDLRSAMQQGAKAPLLCLPTGGGKTVILATIAAQVAARGRHVLILVHRRELIHQTSSKLAWVGLDYGIIAAGLPTTDHPIQIASVQTLIRRLGTINTPPDLIVIDEAHHATAGSWGRILSHWPDALRLGVTATPIRMDGRGLSAAFDRLVLGPSVADLVSARFLTSARIYAPPQQADLTGIKRRAGDFAVDQLTERLNRPTVTGDAIAHFRRLAGSERAIAFCCSQRHAQHVCESFNAAGIHASTLLGSTDPIDRDRVVARFASGQIQVLVTVDVVSEGFDVPAASCAILLRPTQSLGLYLQQVGRVLRPAPGKDAAIVLDHVGNVHRHGWPDDHREWSLEGIERRGASGATAPSVRVCEKCFAAFKPAPVCPMCGVQCAPEFRRQLRQVDGELQELTRDANGIILNKGDRVRVEGYPGQYFYFGSVVTQHPGLVQLFKKRSDCTLKNKTLDSQEIASMQQANNDPLCVFNTFRGMVARGGGNAAIDAACRRAQAQARSLPQLLALAKERGYSPAWAYKVHNARQQRA